MISGCVFILIALPILLTASEYDESSIHELADDTTKVSFLLDLGMNYCSVENDKALGYLQEAFTLSTKENYDIGTGRSLLWQGRVYYYKDNYPLANKYFELAKEKILESSDQEALPLLFFFRGELCKLQGDFISAVDHYKQVIDLTSQNPVDKISSASYLALGHILMKRRDPKNALGYFRKGLVQKQEIGDEYGIACVYTQFGEAFEMLQEYDSALIYYSRGLEIREKLDISRVIASSKYAMSGLLIKQDRCNEAIEMLEDAIYRFEELDEKTGVCISKYRLAEAYSCIMDPRGISLALQTQKLAAEIKNPTLVSLGYQSLSNIYVNSKQYDKAYIYQIKYKNLEDSLFTAEKERLLIEFEQKFQLEQKDNKIVRLNDEGKIQRKNILLLTISSATLLIIVVLIFILMRYKSLAFRKSVLLLEQENIIHAQESKLRENENQILLDQLETKNRELASKALEMIRYNDTIHSILERLDEIHHNPDIGEEVSAHIRSIINDLDRKNKQNIWDEFDKIFKNIHSGFYTRLLEKCPDLTPSEIKTAALLKLNLTTKEIAAITYKSEGGIKTTRYRLRKKFGLSCDDKLIPFLIKI